MLRVACCVVAPEHRRASRTTQPDRASSRAFTLIEIMIVVGIMGIVMTMSVPIVYKVWRKAPMREAVEGHRGGVQPCPRPGDHAGRE